MKIAKDELRKLLSLVCLFAVVACSGAGAPDSSTPETVETVASPPPAPAPPASSSPDTFTKQESAAFLMQATFGPTMAEIEALENASASQWLLAQFEQPASYHLPNVLAKLPDGDVWDANGSYVNGARIFAVASFWEAAILGSDQLRQRMAYALSQILVTSAARGSPLEMLPHTQAAYIDILVKHAFGNYRDLLEDITYSVAMAKYLTYLRNRKGDPQTGRVPDENFARELMQLFTIGLIELNRDGTPKLRGGEPTETYNNEDITGLARVFTGLGLNGETMYSSEEARAPDALYTRLKIFPEWHSKLEKSFLGITIPANTPAELSIDQALDVLFNHPNVAPFISRQLIQRFVTSNPEPAYVARVARAFDVGIYILPDGTAVGEGQRGDLRATIAAILFDDYARDPELRSEPGFGKLREPAIRFTHWARAFEVNSADAAIPWSLRDTSDPDALNQQPLNAPSVFNFYRPGYVPSGTEAAANGITAPEFQLVNSVSIVGYANFMSTYIFGYEPTANQVSPPTFQPDYRDEIVLADDPTVLVDHLDTLLVNGRMTALSKERIATIVTDLPLEEATQEEDLERRVGLAVLLIMTSPEYLIQR